MKKQNLIFLVGFMGSGKNYLGHQLANQLGYDFVDTDELIELSSGEIISELFQSQGEAAFREYEASLLVEMADLENTVVATGGGMPCREDQMERLNAMGKTIYLKAGSALLQRRLVNDTYHRPLITGKTDGELLSFIEAKLVEREAFYGAADMIYYLHDDEAENTRDFLEIAW